MAAIWTIGELTPGPRYASMFLSPGPWITHVIAQRGYPIWVTRTPFAGCGNSVEIHRLLPPGFLEITRITRKKRASSMRFLFAGLLFAAALGLSACSSAGGMTVDASGPSSLGKASNVSCTAHPGKVTVAGTFIGGPSSGVVGFSTSIYDSNGRQIGSENNVSI